MVKINADGDKETGLGGNDIEVGIQTELLPTPHLVVTINRLGDAPYATDLEVLVSFPFDAFNTEILPGDPNLFIGYHTTGPDQAMGGHAPLSETIEFFPNIIAGDDHEVELAFTTVGADNPVRLLTGFFDGTNLTGILDAAAYTAWLETPPETVALGLDVDNSDLFGDATDMSLGLTWDASAPTKVVFDYLEEEFGALGDADYNTTITVDQMPTHEELFLSLDETLSEVTLSHRANAAIGSLEILSERNDGMTIRATATDIPTEVDLVLNLSGSATLDVNENTLDLKLEAIQEGGFLDTSDFLGYDLGYVSVGLKDAPDLAIGYLPGTDSIGVLATNPGECIGAVELVIGDDENLELPPYQDELGFARPGATRTRGTFSPSSTMAPRERPPFASFMWKKPALT